MLYLMVERCPMRASSLLFVYFSPDLLQMPSCQGRRVLDSSSRETTGRRRSAVWPGPPRRAVSFRSAVIQLATSAVAMSAPIHVPNLPAAYVASAITSGVAGSSAAQAALHQLPEDLGPTAVRPGGPRTRLTQPESAQPSVPDRALGGIPPARGKLSPRN